MSAIPTAVIDLDGDRGGPRSRRRKQQQRVTEIRFYCLRNELDIDQRLVLRAARDVRELIEQIPPAQQLPENRVIEIEESR